MKHVTATVARLQETATVTVEVRPLADEKFVMLDLDPDTSVGTSFDAPKQFAIGCGIAACSGVRYATRLAGRDQTVAVLSIAVSNLSLDAHNAIAHAAMYAAWNALGFDHARSEINVDPDWVLQ